MHTIYSINNFISYYFQLRNSFIITAYFIASRQKLSFDLIFYYRPKSKVSCASMSCTLELYSYLPGHFLSSL